MLQQTQTGRVIEKYNNFLKTFPTVSHLSKAPQSEVLKHWQGLGYNRRALYLKRAAVIICEKYNGTFPNLKSELIKLPGVGVNTAGAVIAFAHNIPAVFIETNIRRVFIHEFFREKENVSDQEIYPLIEGSLPHPEGVSWDVRNFYYALMDYGAYLSKLETNPNRKSEHYRKQSSFNGSPRQARGQILKLLLKRPLDKMSLEKNVANVHFKTALEQLQQEGFIEEKENNLYLKS